MKVIQDLAALYSALLLLTGESGQVGVVITENIIEKNVSGSEDVETVKNIYTVKVNRSLSSTTRGTTEICIYMYYTV